VGPGWSSYGFCSTGSHCRGKSRADIDGAILGEAATALSHAGPISTPSTSVSNSGEIAMRRPHPASVTLAAGLLVALLMPSSLLAQGQPPAPAQQPAPAPGQPPAPAPVKPYNPVAIKPPQPLKDPSFETFRKQLETIANKKDRAGLARLVSQSFFWMAADKDAADKKKSGIDNLSKAIGLDGKDAQGWDLLIAYAGEATVEPDPDRKGVVCGPADPSFDDKAAEALANDTQTDASEWGYPIADGVEVRQAAQASAPVIEKLGLHLVRVLPDDSPAAAVQVDFVRVATPSGKTGYVAIDAVLPLANDQMCYIKDGNAWKIAGYIGGSN
jgi:hypothetical protein